MGYECSARLRGVWFFAVGLLGLRGVDPALLEHERLQYGVTAPKALDNTIVNYVRIVSGL